MHMLPSSVNNMGIAIILCLSPGTVTSAVGKHD